MQRTPFGAPVDGEGARPRHSGVEGGSRPDGPGTVTFSPRDMKCPGPGPPPSLKHC